MTRVSLNDLIPDTGYAIRVRAVTKKEKSPWSNVFKFTTIGDRDEPSTITGLTWVVVGDTFHAEWNPVEDNVKGDGINSTRYEVELTSGLMGKYVSVSPLTGGKVTYDLTLEANRAYFGEPKFTIGIRVRAVDNKNLKGAWSPAEPLLATNAAPGAPTNLTAEGGLDCIILGWTPPGGDNSTDVVGYNIYNDADDLVAFVNATAYTYYTSTYAEQVMKITSVDKFGQESEKIEFDAVLPISPFIVDIEPPEAPVISSANIVNASDGLSANLNVSWTLTPVPEDIAAYQIRYKKTDDVFWAQVNATKDDSSISIPYLTPYLDYMVEVRALDSSFNYSEWSETVVATPPLNTPPSSVTGFTANAGKDSISYSWAPGTDLDIKNYEVTFSTSSTFESGNITFLTGNSTNLTVGGLDSNTTYYARVRATDQGGLSSNWSATDTTATEVPALTQLTDGVAPTTSPTPTVTGKVGFLSVNWIPIVNADLVAYEVHLSTTSDFAPSESTKCGEAYGTTYSITTLPGSQTPLEFGTAYYVKVIAKDLDGAAASSGQASGGITTLTAEDVGAATSDYVDEQFLGVTAALDGKNQNVFSTSDPSGTDYIDGDIWYKKNTEGNIIGQWEFIDGAWESKLLTDTVLSGLNVGKLISGSIQSTDITIGTAGYIKSANYDPGVAGFRLSESLVDIRSGVIAANTLVAGTGIVNNLVIETGGALQSSNYSVGAAGYRLSHSGLELNDAGSSVKADAIKAGVLGGTTGSGIIQIAAGTSLMLNGGHLKSNTYNGGNAYSPTATAGFYLGNDGLRIAQGAVSASALTTGTFTAGTITISTGGSIVGQGFSLSSSGINVTSGSISGASISVTQDFGNSVVGVATTIDGGKIRTGSIVSTQNAIDKNGNTITNVPAFNINLNGAAQFGDLLVRGRVTVGPAGVLSDPNQSAIQSGNFGLSSSVGWRIGSDGRAQFNDVLVKGTVTAGSTITGSRFETKSSGIRIIIEDDSDGSRIMFDYGTGPSYYGVLNPYLSDGAPSVAWTSGRAFNGSPSAIRILSSSGGNRTVLVETDVFRIVDNNASLQFQNKQKMRGFDFGKVIGTTDGTGVFAFNHTMGIVPTSVQITATGGGPDHRYQVENVGGTFIAIKVFSPGGTVLNNTSTRFQWLCFA